RHSTACRRCYLGSARSGPECFCRCTPLPRRGVGSRRDATLRSWYRRVAGGSAGGHDRGLPSENALCVVPASHPLAARAIVRAEDLAGVPMLMISGYSYLRQRIMRNFETADVQPDIVFESSYSAPICAMVARHGSLDSRSA